MREYQDCLHTWRGCISTDRMARWVLLAEISGGRVWDRQRLGWMHNVNMVLGNRGMTMEAERQG